MKALLDERQILIRTFKDHPPDENGCMLKKSLLYLLLILAGRAQAQDCTALGQNPSTAFPVCGDQTFLQKSVPICGDQQIPGPTCNTPGNGQHRNKNPYWYKFTCYKTGTLGFLIKPLILEEDYDWQLFDITGKDPENVYFDRTMYVAMNWSGEYGLTGASVDGTSITVCSGRGQDLFSEMPQLTEGHEYLLLISHFSDTQSGYELSFGGGTAEIIDPVLPEITSLKYDCASYSIGVKLSRKVLCSSLAANGSDFRLSPGAPAIVSARGVTCGNGFDLDSITLFLAGPPAPGRYTVTVRNGSDNNTLLNVCSKQMLAGNSMDFSMPAFPAPRMAAVQTPACGPDEIVLEFPDNIRCSSVAANGSDFTITGPSGVRIVAAATTCAANDLTTTVTLRLNARIVTPGRYTVRLAGSVLSECHIPSLPGGEADFDIPPQPPVLLQGIPALGCEPVSVKIGLSVPVRCSSIAADGSDFTIRGAVPVRIAGATGICNAAGLADSVELRFSGPVQNAGRYEVLSASGTDGNTLLSECWQPAATGQVAVFNAADTVNADFTFNLDFNCKLTTVHLHHHGRNAVNSWNWVLDGTEHFSVQHPVKVYDNFGDKTITLEVSNGICSARKDTAIAITSELTAGFSVDAGPYCPLETVRPVDQSTGNIVRWTWDYGNNATSAGKEAIPMRYFPQLRDQDYTIRLIVENDKRCRDTAEHVIKAARSCFVEIPSAFSPNNDGVNDFFYPVNAYRVTDLRLAVYTRSGQLVFETNDWLKRWDGKINGSPAEVGTYAWMIEYTDMIGEKVQKKGTVVLIR